VKLALVKWLRACELLTQLRVKRIFGSSPGPILTELGLSVRTQLLECGILDDSKRWVLF
jgi:hypothetical protein